MEQEIHEKPVVKAEAVAPNEPPISPVAIIAGSGAGYVATIVASVSVFLVTYLIVLIAKELDIRFVLKLSVLVARYPVILLVIIALYVLSAASWGGKVAGGMVPGLKFVHGLLAGVGIVICHLILTPVLMRTLAKIFSFHLPPGIDRVNPDTWTIILWVLIVFFAGIGAAGSKSR